MQEITSPPSVDFIKQRLIDVAWDDAPIHPIIQRILMARGCRNLQAVSYDLSRLIHFDALTHANQMAQYLHDAIEHQQRILIVGDYDVDGATSIITMMEGLLSLGAKHVDYIVPNRFKTGYGLSLKLLPDVLAKKPDVVVTVDNGIMSHEAVDELMSLGIKVLITDHHQAGSSVPNATVVVNPNQPDGGDSLRALAGVGVAFYVICALRSLRRSLNRSVPSLGGLLDIVALGTVADCVPLTYNNRLLVAKGLDRIHQGKAHPGIYQLIATTRTAHTEVTTQTIGFQLGPKLNAAGRLDDMSVGVSALLGEGNADAIKQLDAFNEERKAIQQHSVEDVIVALSESDQPIDDIIVVYDEHWHEGVLGLMASRIKDHFQRPTIVLSQAEPGVLKGSARSLTGIHLHHLLTSVHANHPDLIDQFGGHAMACGLSLKQSVLSKFQQVINQYARESFDVIAYREVIWHDGPLSPEDFTVDFVKKIQSLGPWGMGFPEPAFAQEFKVKDIRLLKDVHLKLLLQPENGLASFEALYFNAPDELIATITTETLVYCVFGMSINCFRGQETLNLILCHCMCS